MTLRDFIIRRNHERKIVIKSKFEDIDAKEVSMFDSICETDLKLKVAQKVNASMKTNVKEVNVHVAGPFRKC